jgi:PIN domain nuclease of toxin-antitoxin system
VRLLLDTHVFLWWRENSPRLGKASRQAIARADRVFVSAASAWEVAIKIALGKLRLAASFEQGVEQSKMEKLPIQFDHAAAAGELPPHHSDPFDRMLVAQARVEGLTLVIHDRAVAPYDVAIHWV